MRKILSFEDFKLNEDNILMQALGAALSGGNVGKDLSKILGGKDDEASSDGEETSTAVPGESRIGKRSDYPEMTTTAQTYEPEFTITPGNDDFSLYMQHQQGVAGAASIIKALRGTGKLHPDTARINMLNNIPSDRPQIKRDMKAALAKGDQKTAAALFVNMWKEKWNSKSKEAKTAINKPQNAVAKKAIEAAAKKYGVPFEFAATVSLIESGLNPNAGNRRYKGLFAMDPSRSYDGLITPMGNKWSDPYLNADNGVKLLRRDIVQFKRQLGADLASLQLSPWAKNLA
jgi:hypothetical protein